MQALLDREQAHGDRLPVTEVLRHRIEALRGGAEPSGAVEQGMPEVAGPPSARTDPPPAAFRC